MKKLILTTIAIMMISLSFSQLSLSLGWGKQYAKQFPKMGHFLGFNQWQDPVRQEMKYTMQIVEDPRTNKVFVNLSGTDDFNIYKFNDFNFVQSVPTNTFNVWKATQYQSWQGVSSQDYEKERINDINHLNADTFIINQNFYATADYQVTHPYSIGGGAINLMLSSELYAGYSLPSGSNWKSYFFTKSNPYRIKHVTNSKNLELYANDASLSGAPIQTITLTCPSTSTTYANKVSFQYKNATTMYVKYVETYTIPSSSNWFVNEIAKSIRVDTVSIVGGSLTIGNYFTMNGLEQYPTLSFEYSQIYCKETEIYIATSNSDSLGQFGPQFSNAISVFGTPIQFAVPYLFCFSTATSSVVTSINTIEQESINDLMIYPNPNNGQFGIKFQSSKPKETIIIYSITGQEVYRKEVESISGQYNEKIKIESELTGIYFAKIGTKSIKFIKN